MKLRASVLGILGLIATLAAFTAPAHAQATRTWVSGVGDDANPCSRTAPCKTFAGAISKTAAGGEINCIDPGGFGAVTITKAMTIDCANVQAGVVVAGTNGVIVNAGASDVVVLRGIDFMGTVTVPGLNGIRFIAGGALHVEKCLIREFTAAAPNGFGILFQPAAASKLFVSDTVLTNNSAGAVAIKPTGSGGATVTIVRTLAHGNTSGFSADTSAPSTGVINMSVRDSVASGNATFGFSATAIAGSGGIGVLVDHSNTTQNGTGISASGGVAFHVGASTIWANGAGLASSNGGQILTFGNNEMADAGAFTAPPIGLK
ncbi:MAG TPA: right-handed parallel beta-helix repeat-containing protein [Tardiphaga sp.]